MREATRLKLKKTPEGRALLQLLDQAGGEDALTKTLNTGYQTVANWKYRGKVPPAYAVAVGKTEFFKLLGWTKEKVRPDLDETEWHRLGFGPDGV